MTFLFENTGPGNTCGRNHPARAAPYRTPIASMCMANDSTKRDQGNPEETNTSDQNAERSANLADGSTRRLKMDSIRFPKNTRCAGSVSMSNRGAYTSGKSEGDCPLLERSFPLPARMKGFLIIVQSTILRLNEKVRSRGIALFHGVVIT